MKVSLLGVLFSGESQFEFSVEDVASNFSTEEQTKHKPSMRPTTCTVTGLHGVIFQMM
jgi:hypothetical protein